jgi:excisionase family DNA binding protein
MNDVLSIEDACSYLQLSKPGLYKLVRNGKIPGFKLGSVWRFHKESLDKWIQERIQEDTASRSGVKPKKKTPKRAVSR